MLHSIHAAAEDIRRQVKRDRELRRQSHRGPAAYSAGLRNAGAA